MQQSQEVSSHSDEAKKGNKKKSKISIFFPSFLSEEAQRDLKCKLSHHKVLIW